MKFLCLSLCFKHKRLLLLTNLKYSHLIAVNWALFWSLNFHFASSKPSTVSTQCWDYSFLSQQYWSKIALCFIVSYLMISYLQADIHFCWIFVLAIAYQIGWLSSPLIHRWYFVLLEYLRISFAFGLLTFHFFLL